MNKRYNPQIFILDPPRFRLITRDEIAAIKWQSTPMARNMVEDIEAFLAMWVASGAGPEANFTGSGHCYG